MTDRNKLTIITTAIASFTSIILAIIAIFNNQSRLETVKVNTTEISTNNKENDKQHTIDKENDKQHTIDIETAKFTYELIRPAVNDISNEVTKIKLELATLKQASSEPESQSLDCGTASGSSSVIDAGIIEIPPLTQPITPLIEIIETGPPEPPNLYMQQQLPIPKLPPFEEIIKK